jgi:hypothetical protein
MKSLGVDLQLQHLIFQSSFVPSIEYMLTATWVCDREPTLAPIFSFISQWYLTHFMPPGVHKADDLFDPISGPLTKALLHLPIRAGGGLGLPCYELIYYRRLDMFPDVIRHKNKWPWMDDNKNYMSELSLAPLPEDLPPWKPPKSEDEALLQTEPSTYDRLQHRLFHEAAMTAYPTTKEHHKQFRLRWKWAARWRDTRWLKIPPEQRQLRIECSTFRCTLSATALYVPGLNIYPGCNSHFKPTREVAASQADVLDHILHCTKCASSTVNRKHDTVNFALRRVLGHYGISYSMEPRGFPVVNLPEHGIPIRKREKRDGPDGLLNTYQGVTAIEIHNSHQRLFYDAKDTTTYDSVMHSHNQKNQKYKDFEGNYPGVFLHIMTVSTGGVISSDTMKHIKEQWLPVADRYGRGLLRMLYIEVAFAVGRAVGNLLQVSKLQKLDYQS